MTSPEVSPVSTRFHSGTFKLLSGSIFLRLRRFLPTFRLGTALSSRRCWGAGA